jgi:3',5'-nucleoside bisphosphate phosphatase
MLAFRADLHIHTLLSPCGDLEMSPANIAERAHELEINIIGITDHNTTRHGTLIKKLASRYGIFTLCGAEVTTKEETHCLAFFEHQQQLALFEHYLSSHLPDIKNNTRLFGHQVVIDEQELIVEELDRLLISAINQSINQVEKKVHELEGIFIPAHIDRPKYSVISQLGFIPPNLKADAWEISPHITSTAVIKSYPYLAGQSFIRSSDAHFPHQMGSDVTIFFMEELSFSEIKMALKAEKGRRVEIIN